MPINSFENYNLTWKPRLQSAAKGVKYLELAGELEDDILSGRIKAGVCLPPQRELADFLDIHFTTVTRAYDVCRKKGLIYGVVGKGTFVSSEIALSKANVLELGVVEAFPEVGAKEIVEASKRVLSKGDAGRLFTYADREGRPRAKEAAQKWLSQGGIDIAPERVAVFPGTQSALTVILLSLFQAQDKIAVDEYTYSNFIKLAQLAHLRLVPIPGDKEGILPEALEGVLKKEAIKGIYLMPNKANPTGITMPKERREHLVKILKAYRVRIIEDSGAAFSDEFDCPSFFSMLSEQTLHVASAARFIASGLRIAFVAFPQDCAAKLLSGLHHSAIKASSLDAEILAELILSGAAEKILQDKRLKLKAANAIYDDIFATIGDGFFRTLELKNADLRGAEIERQLLEKGVRVCHSDRFAVRSAPPRSFLRLSISSISDLKLLRTALEIVAKTVV